MFRTFFLAPRIFLADNFRKIKKFFLPDRFFTREMVDKNYAANIGPHSYGRVEILDWGDGGKLTIGDYCSIAGGVKILLGGGHRLDWVTTYPFPKRPDLWPEALGILGARTSRGDVIIGNDVQIGQDAIIMSGVKIGDGAVVGAGAVVTRDIGPYEIVGGVPAKLIKKRFSDSKIKALLSLKWWTWPEEKVRQKISWLCSPYE